VLSIIKIEKESQLIYESNKKEEIMIKKIIVLIAVNVKDFSHRFGKQFSHFSVHRK